MRLSYAGQVLRVTGSEIRPERQVGEVGAELIGAAEPFDAATLKQRVEDFARAENAKPGPISQTLRVAVTGKEIGFGTYESLSILGKDRCLARIDRALAKLTAAS